jgi:phage shock protein C
MSTYSGTSERGFYRDADRAMLGGVCAGLAGYFGLNLRVTRFLAFIAFLMAMPFAVVAYLFALFLIPSESGRRPEYEESRHCCWGTRRERSRRRKRRSRRRDNHAQEYQEDAAAAPRGPSLQDVKERYKTLDQRLAELEKQVTSPRFQLEQEFRKL